MSFSSLGLGQDLLRGLADAGYSSPTPIQAQAIPVVLSGRDLLAAAQTGTGKTAAFVLPLLQRLQGGRAARSRQARALVVVPTRELAAQVGAAARGYGRHLSLRVAVVFGGVGIGAQVEQLKRGADVLIATPGRLLDHLEQNNVELSAIETLVLDEADRMLDMGFIRDIRRILEKLPAARQSLLFSATFSEPIRRLAQGLLKDPAIIDVAPRNLPAERVDQRVYTVDSTRKGALLAHLLSTRSWAQILVFTRTKHGADKLAAYLDRQGTKTSAIHGNKSQGARTRALADFKAARVRVLVATDIAARGLDIAELPVVVNHDLPHVAEDYVHRIGRTGRAGAEGEAISLVCAEERGQLRAIARLIGREIPASTVAGFEPSRPQPGSAKLAAASERCGRHSHRAQNSARRGAGRSRHAQQSTR